jgi:bilirubin oxidase
MEKGQKVTLNVKNQLTEDTTTHWHGLHLPPEMDGGPKQIISIGETWSPTFEVKNNAATYWYHPHMHKKTMEQLNRGAGGLIIIKDQVEASLAIPRTYGVDDIPLVLTSRTFSTKNAISINTIYGDKMLTNGVINAETTLPKQYVRLRLLNVEIERAYNLGFNDGRKFYVIGTDGGLINKPLPVTRLIMLPGERYEVLVNLSNDNLGSLLYLQSFNGGQEFGFPGGEPATSGAFGSSLNNKTFNVLKIKVGATTPKAIKKLPAKLMNNTYLKATDAKITRKIAITDHGPGTPFSFDNNSYDMMAINHKVKLNATEKWTITNNQTFGHSFHIHDVQFSIVSRSSGAIPDYEKGWKDTFFIHINETVSFVARFADYASNDYPFMYHCHMSNHEDEGLMSQFLVIP